MKKKKILVILLIICLAVACVGCGFTHENYAADPDSFTGHLVGSILNFFQGLTATIGLPNYCVAILILTILVKLVTHPLVVKQQKSIKNMAVIQPKMKALNKKYESQPEKKQEAMMKLYKEHNVNPMASCLPLLIQMPIIMVLFWGMRNFIPPTDLAQYYSFFWIKDLSVIVNTTEIPYLLPLLCACTTVIQQIVSMANMQDKTQRMMLFVMPVMFFLISQQFPAALCVYWIFYGLCTGIQTLYINFRLKIGLFASAEDKAASKAAAAENNNQGTKGKSSTETVAKGQHRQGYTHTHNAQEDNGKKLPDKPWQ